MLGRQAVERGLLTVGQIGGIAQPEVACAAEQRGFRLLYGAPDLIDRVVDDLDGMELSKVMAAFGRLSATPLMKAGLMSMQTSSTVAASRPSANSTTGLIDIDEQRNIVVSAPRGGLVDGHPRDVGGVGARPRLVDIKMHHAP